MTHDRPVTKEEHAAALRELCKAGLELAMENARAAARASGRCAHYSFSLEIEPSAVMKVHGLVDAPPDADAIAQAIAALEELPTLLLASKDGAQIGRVISLLRGIL